MRLVSASSTALNINKMDLVRTSTMYINRDLSSNLDTISKLFLSDCGLVPFMTYPHSSYVFFDLLDGEREICLVGRAVDIDDQTQIVGKVVFTKDGEVLAGNTTDLTSVEGVKLRYPNPKVAVHLSLRTNTLPISVARSPSVRNIKAIVEAAYPKVEGNGLVLTPDTITCEDLWYSEADILHETEVEKIFVYLHYPAEGIIFKARVDNKVVYAPKYSTDAEIVPTLKLHTCTVVSIIGPNGRHLYREGGTIPDLPMILDQDQTADDLCCAICHKRHPTILDAQHCSDDHFS